MQRFRGLLEREKLGNVGGGKGKFCLVPQCAFHRGRVGFGARAVDVGSDGFVQPHLYGDNANEELMLLFLLLVLGIDRDTQRW